MATNSPPRFLLVSLCLILLALLAYSVTHADTFLPLTCTDPAISGTQACGSDARVYARPSDNTLVLSETRGWVAANAAYPDKLLLCPADLPSPSPNTACSNKTYADFCTMALALSLDARCDTAPEDPPDIPYDQNVVKLGWIAPTQNADGSTLTDLAGFKIYSGTSADALSLHRTIADKTATSVTLTGYGWGTYYFAVTAYNSKLVESVKSNVKSAEFVEPVRQPGTVTGLTIEIELHYGE